VVETARIFETDISQNAVVKQLFWRFYVVPDIHSKIPRLDWLTRDQPRHLRLGQDDTRLKHSWNFLDYGRKKTFVSFRYLLVRLSLSAGFTCMGRFIYNSRYTITLQTDTEKLRMRKWASNDSTL